MKIEINPIGRVKTNATVVPKHYSESKLEGMIIINDQYKAGLKGIQSGDRIFVIFYFHQSRIFTSQDLTQYPRGDLSREKKGVFDICSPIRPNSIGLSVVEVKDIKNNILYVKGLDMLDGTPILDIKPCRHFIA